MTPIFCFASLSFSVFFIFMIEVNTRVRVLNLMFILWFNDTVFSYYYCIHCCHYIVSDNVNFSCSLCCGFSFLSFFFLFLRVKSYNYGQLFVNTIFKFSWVKINRFWNVSRYMFRTIHSYKISFSYLFMSLIKCLHAIYLNTMSRRSIYVCMYILIVVSVIL